MPTLRLGLVLVVFKFNHLNSQDQKWLLIKSITAKLLIETSKFSNLNASMIARVHVVLALNNICSINHATKETTRLIDFFWCIAL